MSHTCGTHGPADAATAIDPVCGMTVGPSTPPHHASHAGHDYHFCGARCRERFIAAPMSFLGPKKPDTPMPAGTIYTCPMHPEVRQVGARRDAKGAWLPAYSPGRTRRGGARQSP